MAESAESEIISFHPETFKKTVNVTALRVPVRQIKLFIQKWRKLLWNQPKVKNVYADPEGTKEFKAIALKDDKITDSELKAWVRAIDVQVIQIGVQFSADHYSAQEILKTLLPDGVEAPKGYEQAGHILHFNLRDEHLPYKKVIGDVFLHKVKGARTVINKTNSIANEFRVFPHELLAGEYDMIVTMKENGCKFKFDYGKVYWNSKLGTEHQRIVDAIEPGSIVFDLCAGVGPFVIPLAKKNCKVYGNDLNPVSFQFLQENITLNKCADVVTSNLDAREAFREWIQKGIRPQYIILNLPGLALTFLDMLIQAYPLGETAMPFIHCYYFGPDVDGPAYLREELKKTLQGMLPSEVKYRHVRNVAPHKDMYCVEFRLDERIGCQGKRKIIEEQTEAKRQKLDT